MIRKINLAVLIFLTGGGLLLAQSPKKITDFEQVFEGSLNHEAAMMMKLTAVGGKVRGEYYLQLKQEDILLEGEIDKKGNLYLEETDFKGKKLGVFQGKMSKDLVFAGKWFPMNSDDYLPVMLMATHQEYAQLKKNAGLNHSHIWWDKHRGQIGKGKEAWSPEPDELSSVEWLSDSWDFGKIQSGEKVEYLYYFKNTGKYPVKVMRVKPSCGCTTPEWSKEPVQPGEKGFIKAVFDSKGKVGVQMKSITVVMNTEPTHKILTFRGEIENPGE